MKKTWAVSARHVAALLVAMVSTCAMAQLTLGTTPPRGFGVPAVPDLPLLTIKQPLKVGFVYVGAVGTGGWSFQHEQARRAVEREFGELVVTTRVENVPENETADRVFRQLVERGHKLIFATAFGYMEPVRRAAEAYPTMARFEHATGFRTARNLRTYDARTYEGAYLAGILAGRTTRSNTLGVVAPVPIPEAIRNIDAFAMGAQKVNPSARVRVQWVNAWFNPPAEARGAQTLIDGGADVLLQLTDSSAVLQTAERNGKRAIGWDSDMSAYAPRAHLASSVVNWAPYYIAAVRAQLNGTWSSGRTWWGVREGAIDLVSLADDVPADVRELIAQARQQLRDGSLSIWKSPLADNRGRTVLEDGVSPTDRFLEGVNFYVKGVEGDVPGAPAPASAVSSAPAPLPLPGAVQEAGADTTAPPGCERPAAGVLNVRIGHVAPLTGPIAHLGQDNENGARLAVEDLNAKCLRIGEKLAKFELVPQDDAGDPATGNLVAQRLVAMRVNGVVGHLNSGTTIPAAKIYRDAGIVQLSPSSTNPRYTRLGYSTAFRMLADDQRLGQVLGRYAVEVAEGKRVVIVDDRTAYGEGVADAFQAGVLKAGGKVLRRDVVNQYATEFSLQVMQIKAANPDVVFYGGMDVVAGPLLKQLRRAGVNAKFMGGDGICTRELIALAGADAADDTVLCAEAGGVDEEFQPGMNEFRKRYGQRFGMPVQLYAPYAYDAVNALAQAMQTAGSIDPTRYRAALAANSFVGVTGPVAFDANGDNRNGVLTLYAYGGGRRVAVAVLH
jgi:ABC-type branched-subunit amino acid transport system substrate-binding protein/basic membrane lipoprotein Med (substrate-binding protein (PBP1-ABC) superfamily)